MLTYSLSLQAKIWGYGKERICKVCCCLKEYFKEFKRTVPQKVLKKIYQVFLYIMTLEIVPSTYLRNIEGEQGLYEIRVEEGGNIYRIFCCFDEGQLVILFNAFQKKTQKTPKTEIEKAKRIMKEYFELKNKS